MSKIIPGNQTHLTLDDRLYIEHSLNVGRSLKDISRFLCKDPTTISKEIKLHRIQGTWNKGSFNNPYNFCIHRFRCKKTNACEKIIICDTLCRSCHKCNMVCSRL
ncbi:MAG: helix-turn-helix domain-containing protein [Clostridia bacterium]|nr:helix-turn-helix domain-containing protein [Clostridia bacterium]